MSEIIMFIKKNALDWQSIKKLDIQYLKYLILETPYTFLSTFSWHFNFTRTERSITCVFNY